MGSEANSVLQARGLMVELGRERSIKASFCLAPQEVLRVAGPSGCGKTTLLRTLARLNAASGGEILLQGRPAAEVDPLGWRRQVVYLSQQPVMLEGTVEENLLAGFATSQAPPPPPDLRQQGVEMMDSLGLDPAKLISQDARTLSGGEAARLALCRALLINPAVLLADEPTASLDAEHTQSLTALLARWTQGGGALVVVAHDSGPWQDLPGAMLTLEEEALTGEAAMGGATGR